MMEKQFKEPVAIASTGAPTREHRKSDHSGHVILGWSLALMAMCGAAVLSGFIAVALTLAGICVALLVVGLLLHYEGERQRQRADLPPAGSARR
jgi:putative exporter of polyketide antibiotics